MVPRLDFDLAMSLRSLRLVHFRVYKYELEAFDWNLYFSIPWWLLQWPVDNGNTNSRKSTSGPDYSGSCICASAVESPWSMSVHVLLKSNLVLGG